jgi:arylsulfatase A-like enzyme
MRAVGYETGAFTEDGFIVPRVGFLRGFSTYRENTSPNLHEPLGQSAKTFRDAIDWLTSRRDHPTFLFAHTYEVHFPYTPAPPYDGAFESADELSDENAIELLRYEQEARHLDDELRAFLDAVDALGLGRRTLVVVMADHGEEFLEHGQKRHGLQLYDESIHVPLMVRFPGVVPAGLRVATPVSLVDVAPTILDLVGAPALIGADGESLMPLFGGGSLPRRRAVFSEAMSSLKVGIDLLSVHLPDLHCIYRTRAGTSECYDGAEDPDEHHPLGADRPSIEDARSEAIAYWSLRRTTPAPTGPWELVHELSKDGDAARLEKLRALGYVE